MNDELPDYEHPPVAEIVAAVQFAPVPAFDIAQVVSIGRQFEDWSIVDSPPAIPPMTEGPVSQNLIQQAFIFGKPPLRVILSTDDGRWTGQVQQDRVAVHERKATDRPSFKNVAPKLRAFSQRTGDALGTTIFQPPHAADMVELVYENRIASSDGGWTGFGELHRVLRFVSERAGDPPYDAVEQATVAFSYSLADDSGQFDGRLRVISEPQYDDKGQPVLGLRVISRRFVRGAELDLVLEACHADIVRGFTAITTDDMHKIWGRYR